MIHERGYWLGRYETQLHQCDIPLCDAIISILKDMKSIIDVGCGNGGYTKHLIDNGFECVGYDGSPLTPEISDGLCGVMDFSQPVEVGEFDLVLCLEVGEHVPAHYEQVFIDNLVTAAKQFIVISWATIGQCGSGHVNCQDNQYVIDEFFKRGFAYKEDKTQFLRDNATFWWFENTTMVFEKII